MNNSINQYGFDWALWWKIGLSTISGLALIVGWFLKKWMHRWDEFREDIEKQGGIVTRDIFYKHCDERQGKCLTRIGCKFDGIEDWRDAMIEKGGPVLKKDHDETCERVVSKSAATFAKMVDEKFAHHRELVTAQFGEFSAKLQKNLIEVVAGLKRDLINNGSKK